LIKKLVLKNFECHKDLTIDFDKNLTLITGFTRSGKSSIIRGLEWVLKNNPSGNSMVSHDTDYTSVLIILDDGTKIKREKVKGKNAYYLNAKKFEAPNTNVPEEIQDILKIDIVNIQSQFDTHFLLMDSSLERVKKVNEATKTNDIDNALLNISSIKKYTNNLVINIDKKSIDLNKEKRNYRGINRLKKKLNLLQTEQDCINELKGNLKKLKTLNTIINNSLMYENIESLLQNITILLKHITKLNTEKEKLRSLNNIKEKICKNKQTLKQYTDKVGVLEQTLKKEFPSICPLCTNIITKEKLDEVTYNSGFTH